MVPISAMAIVIAMHIVPTSRLVQREASVRCGREAGTSERIRDTQP